MARPDVLARIASDQGVVFPSADTDRLVRHDYEEGKRRGVRGSPEFFLDGHGWYCPSLRIDKVGGALRIQPDVEQVQAFLAACFG